MQIFHSTACKYSEQSGYHQKTTQAGDKIIEIIIIFIALENTVTLLSENIIFLDKESKSKDMETLSLSTQIYQYDKCDNKARTKMAVVFPSLIFNTEAYVYYINR